MIFRMSRTAVLCYFSSLHEIVINVFWNHCSMVNHCQHILRYLITGCILARFLFSDTVNAVDIWNQWTASTDCTTYKPSKSRFYQQLHKISHSSTAQLFTWESEACNHGGILTYQRGTFNPEKKIEKVELWFFFCFFFHFMGEEGNEVDAFVK